MTKLEELAQRIENPRLSRIGIEQEIETALKPLLDAVERAGELLDEYPEFKQEIGEQLSQWRKK